MDTEPRTTTPNKEDSIPSTDVPTAAKTDLITNIAADHLFHRGTETGVENNGATCHRGETVFSKRHASDKGNMASATAAVTSTSKTFKFKMTTHRARKITETRLMAKGTGVSEAVVATARVGPVQPPSRMNRSPRVSPMSIAATTHSNKPSLTTMLTIKCCTCPTLTTRPSQPTRRKARMCRTSHMPQPRFACSTGQMRWTQTSRQTTIRTPADGPATTISTITAVAHGQMG